MNGSEVVIGILVLMMVIPGFKLLQLTSKPTSSSTYRVRRDDDLRYWRVEARVFGDWQYVDLCISEEQAINNVAMRKQAPTVIR